MESTIDIAGISCRVETAPKRRNPGLRIADGTVCLVLPPRFPESAVRRLLEDNLPALRRMQSRIDALPPPAAPPEFEVGGTLQMLGHNCPVERGFGRPVYENGVFAVHPVYARQAEFLALYRKLALSILTPKVTETAAKAAVMVTGIRIGSAGGRWGSCSSAGHLNFPWKLILCPEDLVDYVVAHEVAHRKHMDHSPEFWQEVGKLCPQWRYRRQRLRHEELRLRSWENV